jgi:ribosomal subunit interface protein
MKISYTGKVPKNSRRQRAKLEAKLQKLSKVLEQRGEKEAHVVLTQERFLHKVEITMNAWDHALVGIATDGDLAVAAHEAFERLEKQLLKLRARWRDTKRRARQGSRRRKRPAQTLPGGGRPASKKAAAARPARQESRAQAGVSRQSFAMAASR